MYSYKKMILFLCAVVGFAAFSGCSSVGYYSQSIAGHTSLMIARKPIDEVMVDADDKLKQKLTTAAVIREFAINDLSLPDNQSYTTYVQLKNDPPVWNVVAAQEFSLSAKQWCYLVIGCASYRGYYDKADAEKYADEMKEKGYDVALIGAPAYSTLGWFADPLTSAMLRRSDASLAELIFHELAHQQLYIKGDSRFNEAFASAVGEQGAIKWLMSTNQDEKLLRYQKSLSVQDDFLQLINAAKADLRLLYASDLLDKEKRIKKQAIFDRMKTDYQRLKVTKWNGEGWYGRWFSRPINNARLASISTYRDLVPEFVQLFNDCEQDFSRFYRKVADIGATEERRLTNDCH